jgi:hypothetical protein
MIHHRILGSFWFLAGIALLVFSLRYDVPKIRDGELDAWVVWHWVASGVLVATGVGLFHATKWARVTNGVLLLPIALLCLDLFLMFGVTRSGRAYFFACLPFLIMFLVLPYNAIVLFIVRPKGQGDAA